MREMVKYFGIKTTTLSVAATFLLECVVGALVFCCSLIFVSGVQECFWYDMPDWFATVLFVVIVGAKRTIIDFISLRISGVFEILDLVCNRD